MINSEGYNYEEFLSDSSDDSPKYDEGIERKPFVIKQADDDMNYQRAYSQTEIRIALQNVIELAGERLEQFHSPDYMDADIVNGMESIQAVKHYFFNSGEAVFNNSQIARDNKE